MLLLDLQEELEIESESLIAVLDSVLRTPGSEKKLAQQVEMTPVYLSYIRSGKRVPRVRTAQKIARALPLPLEQRQAWVYHVERYWVLKRLTLKEVRRSFGIMPPQEAIQEARTAHHLATFASGQASAKALYRKARDLADMLLKWMSPDRDPINFIELCFVVHDADCVLNRHAEALWYATRARRIAQALDPRDYRASRERLDFIQVNSIRAEAIAYHNLKLDRAARDRCLAAQNSSAMKQNELFWKPHVFRDQINALEHIPRFSITEAENLADEVRRICERRGDDFDPLMELLISQSLARAYIAHHNFKDASRVLREQFDQLDSIPHVGPLHQVIFLRTYARLYWRQSGPNADWQYLASRALRMALQSGLEHQANEMRKEYGNARKLLDLN